MYRQRIVQGIAQLLLLSGLCIGATACGQKGDLYMPEQAEQANASSIRQ